VGTIVERKREDGTKGFTAQIRINRDGRKHTEAQTFDRKQAAAAWLKKRETELAVPGALDRINAADPLLSEVIGQYLKETIKEVGRSKENVLGNIKKLDIAALRCSEITSDTIAALANDLVKTRQPSTVFGYLSHLRGVFAVARPAWGYPLDKQIIDDAIVALRRLGTVDKSKRRERRPTPDELDKLMTLFGRRKGPVPMQAITAFAIFSTRRQDEICSITWADLDETNLRVLVRDMKDPGGSAGNNVWCDLTPEALQIIQARPRTGKRIFPYTAKAVSSAFTKACQLLGIDDLNFHDLRHHGISRLFEMGRNIPQVACVSGHRSWSSLQRHAHIRQSGDCLANWKWLEVVTVVIAGTP
jgi:integrase